MGTPNNGGGNESSPNARRGKINKQSVIPEGGGKGGVLSLCMAVVV